MAELAKEYNFSRIEEETLKFWKESGINERMLSAKRRKIFSFLEGPPTANAPPGLHHAEVRIFKDLVCRFKFMQGYAVPRKGGWDCHGLPVEVQVEKQLGLNSKKEVLNYGIDKFNQKCREDVFSFIGAWNEFTERLAYLIDLKNPYRTLDNEYIESVWWSLKELYKKGLLFVDYKVVPYCPRCGTSLSSHEVALGYKDVTEDSVTCKFKVKGMANTYLLAWTTTPWTLPSNLALAVHPDFDYAFIADGDNTYIMAEALAGKYFDRPQIVKKVKGSELIGVSYEPIFPYFAEKFKDSNEKAFVVIGADYVTLEDGTGIVHQAPAFGEDDFESCKRAGIGFVNPVSEDGRFTSEVSDFEGMFVKDADRRIIEVLQERGILFKKERYTHAYPFCWRCNTPLLYYARQSWFIRVSQFRQKLLEKNSEISWYPEHIKDGRFGNWLEGAKDWALSRSKFWGTPLPIWKCQSCGVEEAIGSVAELREKGLNVPKNLDLHKPFIDEVKLRCKCGGEMTRVPDVIDCWYDSGSASFAQFHYPFENKREFRKRFPYDFIAEATDQTRGWFYTLHVLGTLLFDSPAYKSVVCAGLLVDENGEKMSKSKGNIINPWDAFREVGVDAVRLQMCYTSPGLPKKFSYKLVRESVYPFINAFWNSAYFLSECIKGKELKEVKEVTQLACSSKSKDRRKGIRALKEMNLQKEDLWIISRANTTVKECTAALEGNEYHNALKSLIQFAVEDVSRWYLKLTRRRMESGDPAAIASMLYALDRLCRMTAPLAPYISEEIYQKLLRSVTSESESIHECSWPQFEKLLNNKKLEFEMEFARKAVTSILSLRDEANMGVRWPLSEATFVSADSSIRRAVKRMAGVVCTQANIKKLRIVARSNKIISEIKPEYAKLGPAFAKKTPKVVEILRNEDPKKVISDIERTGEFKINVDGEELAIKPEHLVIERKASSGYLLDYENNYAVLLHPELNEELIAEGYAREIIRRVQEIRKNLGMKKEDRIILSISSAEEALRLIGKERIISEIKQITGSSELKISTSKEAGAEIFKIKDYEFWISISKV
ncbi:MAG: isoleucine--tRNA ligase [Candidatus Woesearchaeota archaeon]